MYKFGHTSPISLPPIPSQDAIPLNTVSHGVVGIMRPVTKKQNKIVRDLIISSSVLRIVLVANCALPLPRVNGPSSVISSGYSPKI